MLGRSKQLIQICPICGKQHPLEVMKCSNCGAALSGAPEISDTQSVRVITPPAPLTPRAHLGQRTLPPIESPVTQTMEIPVARKLPRRQTPQRIEVPSTTLTPDETDFHSAMMPRTKTPLILFVAIIATVLVGGASFVLVRNAMNRTMMGAEPETTMAAIQPTESPTPTQTGTFTVVQISPTAPLIASYITATPIDLLPTGFVTATPTFDSFSGTNTPVPAGLAPTLAFPTVTPVPPSPTLTPTRGPCLQKAKAGDTLYGLAVRCGHEHYDVVAEILKRNNMGVPEELKIGQELDIPWPTPTGGAPGDNMAASGGMPASGGDGLGAEPTLPPSLRWITVKKGQTALDVIAEASITMKILEELNPEVVFETCDFSLASGGASCRVMLFEGQRLRVPAPATATPVVENIQGPTPLPTATVNAPFSQSPSDNMLFEVTALPTIRWTAPGQLLPNESYMLLVTNTNTGITYQIITRDTSFQLSADWQPRNGEQNTFVWSVAIVRMEGNNAIPLQTTESRKFIWVGRQ
jgi:LysM repeat protein